MIATAVTSPAPISFPIGFFVPTSPFHSLFPARFVSIQFPSISSLYPIKKDIVHNFRAFECHFLGKASAYAVATKVESESEVDEQKQKLSNIDALEPTSKDGASSNVVVVSSGAKTVKNERNPKRLSSSAARITKLDHLPVIRYPLSTESAIKVILEHNTLVFVVDKQADKNNIKDAVKTMFNVRAKKVNTSIMPDGTKKAFIMLAPEFKALDVAKKVKIL